MVNTTVRVTDSFLTITASDRQTHMVVWGGSKSLNTTTLEHTSILKNSKTSHFLGDADEQERREHLTYLERNF